MEKKLKGVCGSCQSVHAVRQTHVGPVMEQHFFPGMSEWCDGSGYAPDTVMDENGNRVDTADSAFTETDEAEFMMQL